MSNRLYNGKQEVVNMSFNRLLLMSKKSREALLNQQGIVIEDIQSEINMGKVYINHHEYPARSISGKDYPQDTVVKVMRVSRFYVYVKMV